MSDIVERLRADPLRNFDEAAEKIERLQQKLAEYTVAVQRRDAEIERLNNLLRLSIEEKTDVIKTVERQEKEISRLKREYEEMWETLHRAPFAIPSSRRGTR